MSGQFYKLKIYTDYGTNWLVVSSPEHSDVTDEKSKVRTVINALPLEDSYKSVRLMLANLEYEKQLFAPCSATAEITVGVGDADRSKVISALRTCFEGKSVDILLSGNDKVPADDSDFHIGRDYIVFGVQPYYTADNTAFSVTLELFSRDKLLTLDKFSRCYLNKRLGQDILVPSLGKNGILGTCNVSCDAAVTRLQHLSYNLNQNDSNSGKDEQIQPYRVQYNEDFHSFVSRIACTCGEFLFFEGGKLNLGLPVYGDDKVIPLVEGRQILGVKYPQTYRSQLSVKSFYNEYHREESGAGKVGGLIFNEESAYDEYFDVFDSDDKPDDFGKEVTLQPYIKTGLKGIVPAVWSGAKKRGWLAADGGIKAAIELGKVSNQIGISTQSVNDKYIKTVFDGSKENTENFKEDLQKDGTKLSQFASVNGYERLMAESISRIREIEKKTAGDVIKLKLKAGTDCRVGLGDYVRLGTDTTVYVVTRVSGMSRVRKVQERGSLVESYSLEDSQSIELAAKEENSFYPPYNACAEPVRVSAQTAVVADSDDPRSLGRVRLKYPWQPKGDKASPWVRFVAPMASKNGATAHFKLFKGDEVMVDYQGGNIERPYVIGVLFNSASKPYTQLSSPYDRTIRSQTGEYIDFKGGSYDKYVSDLIPAYGMLSSYLPWLKSVSKLKSDAFSDLDKASELDGKVLPKTLHGSITLSDANGFWTIKGDTAAREVTIDSMLGKVTVSSLTGIKITTKGDLDIDARNINIRAGNNITLESGVSIRSDRANKKKNEKISDVKSFAKEFGKGCLADILLGKVDYSLIRTIAEIMCPPMEGTLRIKSNRYLNLEAGDGKSFDADAANPKNSFVSKADREMFEKAIGDARTIGATIADNLANICRNCNLQFPAVEFAGTINNLADRRGALIGRGLSAADADTLTREALALRDYPAGVADNEANRAYHTACRNFAQTLDGKVRACDTVDFRNNFRGQADFHLRLQAVYREIPGVNALFSARTDQESINAKSKEFRRKEYLGYLQNLADTDEYKELKKIACADCGSDVEWTKAVKSLYTKSDPKGLKQVLSDKLFSKNGIAFVNYDKYGSEYYIKNPTAKGRILLSQNAGRTYHIQNDGTLRASPVNEWLRNIQRKLMDNDNFDAAD